MSTIDAFHDQQLAAGGVEGELRGRAAILNFGDPAAEYRATRQGVAVADVSDRTQIRLTGEDRTAFLHNLCTNDIRKLSAGSGCEAFLLNAQGRILGHVQVFAEDDTLVVESSPGHTQALMSQLDRYLIREKVELSDASEAWGQLLLIGPRADECLADLNATAPASAPLSNCDASIAGHTVRLRRTSLAGETSLLIAVQRDDLFDVWNALRKAGAVAMGASTVEICRVEAGSPVYGLDISDRSLPQEVARDERAISFAKGCYIGQETVARIDARGHVNKFLVGVQFEGHELPAAETSLSDSSGEIGTVTSSTFSPTLDAPLALAYVKRGFEGAGQEFQSPLGAATIVKLPL